jgi:hypothetical protein
MSKNSRSNILSVLARTVLAFVFVFGQTAWAMQGQNAKDKPTSDAVAKAQQTPPNVSTAGSKAQPAEEKTATSESSSAKEDSHHGGQHEGITVHGHWSIEVHNPDGSLVRHVEFENSLDPGFSYTDSSGLVHFETGGAAYLSAVASGEWSGPKPADWTIYLVGPSGLSKVLTATDAPCILACVVGGTSTGACSNGVSTTPSISCNLSVTALGAAPGFTGIQLSGSIAATQNGQIGTVLTLIAPLSCTSSFPNCALPANPGASFTSSTNFPGAPISVIAGQTIAVTVNISFS